MKKTITYEQFLNKKKQIKELQDQGVVFIFKKNKFKIVIGISLISIGVLTFPIPTGSIPMIALGCFLLGITTSDLLRFKDEIFRQLKNKIRRRG